MDCLSVDSLKGNESLRIFSDFSPKDDLLQTKSNTKITVTDVARLAGVDFIINNSLKHPVNQLYPDRVSQSFYPGFYL